TLAGRDVRHLHFRRPQSLKGRTGQLELGPGVLVRFDGFVPLGRLAFSAQPPDPKRIGEAPDHLVDAILTGKTFELTEIDPVEVVPPIPPALTVQSSKGLSEKRIRDFETPIGMSTIHPRNVAKWPNRISLEEARLALFAYLRDAEYRAGVPSIRELRFYVSE